MKRDGGNHPMQDSPVKELLKKGIQKSLEEQQVPLHLHLKVVDALSKSMVAHKADLNLIHVMANRHAMQLNQHDAMTKVERETHNQKLAQMDAQIASFAEKDWTGEPGKDADPLDTEAIMQELLSRIPVQEPLDKEAFKQEILAAVPQSNEQEKEKQVTERIITKIQKEKVIDVSHIRNAESFIFNTQNKKMKVKFEELMSGIGKSTGGTSGFQVPTGTVNGTNQVFVWTTAPSVIVVDQGRAMQRVSSDGTVNWTIVGTTTTLAIAPTFDVYSTN